MDLMGRVMELSSTFKRKYEELNNIDEVVIDEPEETDGFAALTSILPDLQDPLRVELHASLISEEFLSSPESDYFDFDPNYSDESAEGISPTPDVSITSTRQKTHPLVEMIQRAFLLLYSAFNSGDRELIFKLLNALCTKKCEFCLRKCSKRGIEYGKLVYDEFDRKFPGTNEFLDLSHFQFLIIFLFCFHLLEKMALSNM